MGGARQFVCHIADRAGRGRLLLQPGHRIVKRGTCLIYSWNTHTTIFFKYFSVSKGLSRGMKKNQKKNLSRKRDK